MDLMEEAFRDVSVRDYRINITECNTFHRITVSHMTSANEYVVTIPMQERMGARFGTCTLNSDAHYAILVDNSAMATTVRV